MKSMWHDLSAKLELQPLAEVVRPLQAASEKLHAPFFLMGAAARDVMLLHVYGIDTKRLTQDMDFGVMVRDWATFEAVRAALLASGAFVVKHQDVTHKLWHVAGRPLDIVPFGGVERADRTLAWPPTEETVFDCFGMREAMASGHDVGLPGGVSLRVASLPALALLKITAWQDRKLTHPGRDAGDLMLYLHNYLDCGMYDHAAQNYPELFDAPDYDHGVTGARLLGRDLRQLLDDAATARVLEILQPQADEQGARLLAQQSGMANDLAIRMIKGLCEGLQQDKQAK